MQKSVLDTGLSTKDETIDFNDDLSGPYSGICPGGLNIFSLEGGLKPTEIHRFLWINLWPLYFIKLFDGYQLQYSRIWSFIHCG